MTVYERIENLRKSMHISSQGKLEKELGFSNGSISKWKNSTPTPDRLKKLSEYFGVSIDYLLTGEEAEISDRKYYINEDTAETAQEIFEKDKILFDVYNSSKKEQLVAFAKKLEELRKMEEGDL